MRLDHISLYLPERLNGVPLDGTQRVWEIRTTVCRVFSCVLFFDKTGLKTRLYDEAQGGPVRT